MTPEMRERDEVGPSLLTGLIEIEEERDESIQPYIPAHYPGTPNGLFALSV